MEKNPEVVQPENWLRPGAVARSVPAILIHDGGGTTFAYHCLDPLNRLVYGIHNPHFHDGGTFEGGIREMGALYSGFIRELVAGPDFPARRNAEGGVDIILGGWSLGGMLSLEVANQLADDTAVKVIGILMIDSVYPIRPSEPVVTAPADTSEDGKTKNQILSQRTMFEARRMIQTWELPVWDARPRTVLLRATQPVPTKAEGVNVVDVYRENKRLGWDQYDKDMFAEVVDVEGHHFNLFPLANIKPITASIKRALDGLEMAAEY
ncbi:hypothetical protein G7046_g522 [Stylonectria norvegica]|nr:hypothetical protein G7046_g522 [Stylonectria norvegica]